MKNTENAESPISAMVYWPGRNGPLRRSGRPAQVAQIANPGFQDAHRASESRNSWTSEANRAEKAGHDAEIGKCGGSDSSAFA